MDAKKKSLRVIGRPGDSLGFYQQFYMAMVILENIADIRFPARRVLFYGEMIRFPVASAECDRHIPAGLIEKNAELGSFAMRLCLGYRFQ